MGRIRKVLLIGVVALALLAIGAGLRGVGWGSSASAPAMSSTSVVASPSVSSGVGEKVAAPPGSAGFASGAASGAASGSGAVGLPARASAGGTTSKTVTAGIATPTASVIETGDIALVVHRSGLTSAFNAVARLAGSEGGFVADSSRAALDQQSPSESLRVRVPSARFTSLVTSVLALGKVQSQSEQGQDVTGQVINLTARIDNLQAEETALRTLVQQAGSIPDILTVENELFGVEQQVEVLSAQQSSLYDRTTFATLTVDLMSSAVVVHHHKRPPPPPANVVVRGARLAWHNLVVAGRTIVLAVGWAFPLLVLAAIVGLVVWLRRRHAARPRPASSPMPG